MGLGIHRKGRKSLAEEFQKDLKNAFPHPPPEGIFAPGTARTCDPRFRRPMLYPTELREHKATEIIPRPPLNASSTAGIVSSCRFQVSSFNFQVSGFRFVFSKTRNLELETWNLKLGLSFTLQL